MHQKNMIKINSMKKERVITPSKEQKSEKPFLVIQNTFQEAQKKYSHLHQKQNLLKLFSFEAIKEEGNYFYQKAEFMKAAEKYIEVY